MHASYILLMVSTATAFSFPDPSSISSLFARKDDDDELKAKDGKCPTVWATISKDLTSRFLTDGQCNPAARAAIRAIFHDCGGMSRFSTPLQALLMQHSMAVTAASRLRPARSIA